jgi:hypothetical protein
MFLIAIIAVVILAPFIRGALDGLVEGIQRFWP